MAGMPKRRARRRNPEAVVPVVFRVWETGPRSVIALFPTLPATHRPGSVTSYEHTGQHGDADYRAVMSKTRAATPAEYAPLARELRSIGYRLRIVRRAALRRNPGPLDTRQRGKGAGWYSTRGKRGALITLVNSDFGNYEVLPVKRGGGKHGRWGREGSGVLVQTDWDYPGVARAFGWTPPKGPNRCDHPSTDGTVDFRECGMKASRLIQSAGRFLSSIADRGVVVADYGGYIG